MFLWCSGFFIDPKVLVKILTIKFHIDGSLQLFFSMHPDILRYSPSSWQRLLRANTAYNSDCTDLKLFNCFWTASKMVEWWSFILRVWCRYSPATGYSRFLFHTLLVTIFTAQIPSKIVAICASKFLFPFIWLFLDLRWYLRLPNYGQNCMAKRTMPVCNLWNTTSNHKYESRSSSYFRRTSEAIKKPEARIITI